MLAHCECVRPAYRRTQPPGSYEMHPSLEQTSLHGRDGFAEIDAYQKPNFNTIIPKSLH